MTDTTTNKGELLWLDMETLGLTPLAEGQILEVAAVLTDRQANEAIARFSAFLPLDNTTPVPVWNAITHGGPDGLLDLCAGISQPADRGGPAWVRAAATIDQILFDMVAGCERAPILAGSSVHFDRRWIDAYMPKLSKRLSYRHLDVRAVLMAHAAAGVDHELGKPKAGKLEAAHRAEADIDYSIEMYRRALSWISSATQPQHAEPLPDHGPRPDRGPWPAHVKVTRSAPLEPCPSCGAKQGMHHVEHCPELGREGADDAKGHSGVRLAGGA